MTDIPEPTARDTLTDLEGTIGGSSDANLRLACLQAAIAATPKYQSGDQIAETLLVTRRFARFVIEGIMPSIQVRSDQN